jgi:hypothetical protein
VAAAIGLTQEPGRADELFPAVRRLFEALAARRPLVVVLEDVHWGEPTLLDLIEHLAENARGPIFLLCLARPELIEERPAWGVGRRSVDTLFLEPLGRADTEELIADRLAGYALPEETVARIVETAQGNPLFVEQMSRPSRRKARTLSPHPCMGCSPRASTGWGPRSAICSGARPWWGRTSRRTPSRHWFLSRRAPTSTAISRLWSGSN